MGFDVFLKKRNTQIWIGEVDLRGAGGEHVQNMFYKILKEHIQTRKCVYAHNHENVSMSKCLHLKEKNSYV